MGSWLRVLVVALVALLLPGTVVRGACLYPPDSRGLVTIPANATSVKASSFLRCATLVTLTFSTPSLVTSIGANAFQGCTSLVSVVLPPSVKSIGDWAFDSCSSLKVLDMASINSIGSRAFSGCSSLVSVTIPTSLTSFGPYVFFQCSLLASVTFAAHSSLTLLSDWAFSTCKSLTTITIPPTVTSIGVGSFYSCSKLVSLAIPSGVTTIGNQAFDLCSSLATISIPPSVLSVGQLAFDGCTALTSMTIPTSVTTLGSSLFQDCTSLASVTFAAPSSLTSIPSNVFTGCSALTSVTIPSSWTSIPSTPTTGLAAFSGTGVITCDPLGSPCLCGTGYGASTSGSGTLLTCSKCPGSTYTAAPGRSYCLSQQPTTRPTQLPTPLPTSAPTPVPTSAMPSAWPSTFPTPEPSLLPTPGPTFDALHSASASSARDIPISLTTRAFFLPDVTFPDLGTGSSYFLSVFFAATGWTNGPSGAYATVAVAVAGAGAGQAFQCRPGNTCTNRLSCTLELCKANVEITPAVLAAAGGTLVIKAGIENANLIQAPGCSYLGSTIYAQYTIQGSHGVPTLTPSAAPTAAAPVMTRAPTAPSREPTPTPPTPVPTTSGPSPAPTALPTMGTRMRVSQTSGAVMLASGGLLGSIAPVTFSGLGTDTTYYLSVGVYGTSFGGNSDANFASLSVTVSYGGRDTVVAAKCNPGDSCPDPELVVCVGNFKLSPPFSPEGGGSIVLKAVTVGFLTTRCTAGGSNVNVTYTLQGTDPMPTAEPSAAPTGIAPSLLLAQMKASTNEIITGTGALFYVIAAVAALFAVLSVLLAQTKQPRPAVCQIGLFSGVIAMTLVGSAFTSEMFLVDAMLGTPSGVALGYVVLLGRVMHLPAACYLLHGMLGGGKASKLGPFLDLDLVFSSAKLFGVAALFSLIDVTVVRFFPWLSSPFSRKADGFPTSGVFRVCVITKLVQSVVTVTCQISYFALVNSAVTAGTPQARSSLAFLCINMTTTILLVVLNGFEYVVKRSVLKGGQVSNVPDFNVPDSGTGSASHQLPPSLPQRLPKQRSIFGRISQRLSFSQVFGSGTASTTSDTIPPSAAPAGGSIKGALSRVFNPMMLTGSPNPTNSQDVELMSSSSSASSSASAKEQELIAKVQALEEANAQRDQEMNAKLQALEQHMASKLESTLEQINALVLATRLQAVPQIEGAP